jgi:predicted AlkP superfamily pyrophosphatase or phosphodiesterase
MNTLPKWVNDFNASEKAKKYLNSTWKTLYDINTYTESMKDNNVYEELFTGLKSPTFPYKLSKLKKKNDDYELLKSTPFGNSIVKDFAEAAVIGENLGNDQVTDFLAIGFSSTDYIGHKFGPDSKEVEDTYLRLDKDIASLLKFLDEKVGKDDYTLFLTADHAVAQVPAYLESLKVPAGYFNSEDFKVFIEKIVHEEFDLSADELIENISNYQLYLNRETLKNRKLNLREVSEVLVNRLVAYKSVYKTVSSFTLQNTRFNDGILHRLQNGYNQKFSGDVLIIPNPSTIERGRTGTTHGSGYNYDSHVPILLYGKGIKKGVLKREIAITDIIPTISNLLKISAPNGVTGSVITEALAD